MFKAIEKLLKKKFCSCRNLEIKFPGESGPETLVFEGAKDDKCFYHGKKEAPKNKKETPMANPEE